MKTTILSCMLAAALVACGQKQEAAATPASAAPVAKGETAALPPGHPATGEAAATPVSAPIPPAQGRLSGKVLETMNAAGYTYLHIQTANGDEWAAVRETKVDKGQPVAVDVQMTAEKFESRSLNRKFDRIAFGNLADGKTPPATAAAPAAAGTPEQHMQAPEVGDVKVAKADGGKTIAEIWAGKDGLKDKDVVFRGKVVKYLPEIMGKNWMHLRDGSGTAAKGDHDITVTTSEKAAVGDVVVVRGKVAVDKDFGAGYRYPVIVEQAKLTK